MRRFMFVFHRAFGKGQRICSHSTQIDVIKKGCPFLVITTPTDAAAHYWQPLYMNLNEVKTKKKEEFNKSNNKNHAEINRRIQ